MSIRRIHESLLGLLTQDEQRELNLANSFSPFAGLRPLQTNPYTLPLWTAAVSQYGRSMGPTETKIAGKLKEKLLELEAKPHQLLREFERYRGLVKRPAVSKALLAERLVQCSSISVYMYMYLR